MLIRRPDDIPTREITPESAYLGRREWLATTGLAALALTPAPLLASARAASGSGDDDPTPYDKATTYNNYYEFGTGKEDPSQNAGRLKTSPWTVEVAGLAKRTGPMAMEDLLKGLARVDRTYRMRCVEGWSMVIPWQGFQLKDLIDRLEPSASARFIEFTTLNDPAQMPGLRSGVLPWPYIEALRLDEARHPLSMMVTGMYGKALPNQNGAPMRLIVPWKYGFKGAKAIVRIRFTETRPATTWNVVLPDEYGFFANVNPEVDHPRWSQARERRIGDFFKRPTLPFNGYADQVASLYSGMDLRKNF
ncbi:MAG: protein-methionine-sulfoxide reductase catalytic subunit MsrP [Gemmatimonadota bacterium]